MFSTICSSSSGNFSPASVKNSTSVWCYYLLNSSVRMSVLRDKLLEYLLYSDWRLATEIWNTSRPLQQIYNNIKLKTYKSSVAEVSNSIIWQGSSSKWMCPNFLSQLIFFLFLFFGVWVCENCLTIAPLINFLLLTWRSKYSWIWFY